MKNSKIQMEFCKALKSLTTGRCGKIAERCEQNATMENFRNAHRINVGEALNKFIFGSVKLFNGNFFKIDQCNVVSIDEYEEGYEATQEGSGSKFGYKKHDLPKSKKVALGVIQPFFRETERSTDSQFHTIHINPMHKRQSTENLFNRILHRRRQQLTNHTTADNIDVSCNEILLIPSQTTPTARKILCKPRAFNENRSKQNQSISYPVYNSQENENVHPSPFLNSSSLLMTMLRYQKLGKNPFSILSPKNYIEDKREETAANSKLAVEYNSIQNITKF